MRPGTGATSMVMSLEPRANEELLKSRLVQVREFIQALPRAEYQECHRFTPGMYVHETTVPKDSLFLTKHHKTEHPYVLLKGKIAVWTRDGGIAHFEAPYFGITKPGTQRIVYAKEESTCITFHATKLTNLDELEGELFDPNDAVELTDEQMKQLTES